MDEIRDKLRACCNQNSPLLSMAITTMIAVPLAFTCAFFINLLFFPALGFAAFFFILAGLILWLKTGN